MILTPSSNYLEPPIFDWSASRLGDKRVELIFSQDQKDKISPFLKDGVFFISLPKGKQVLFKSFQEDEDGNWVAVVKGLSLNEADQEKSLSFASYPWIYTTSAIIAIPTSAEDVVFSRKIPISRLNWQGEKEEVPTRLSFLGQDNACSLWLAYFKVAQRLCLGSQYSFHTSLGEGEALVLSGILSEFKTKRESLGLFLKGAKNLESFFHFRLALGSFVCPPSHQSLLSGEQVKEISANLFLKRSFYDSLKTKTLRLSRTFGGMPADFISEKLGEEKNLVAALLKYWQESGLLCSYDGFYWQTEGVGERLSPLAKALVYRIQQKGAEGIVLMSLSSVGEKETLKALHRIGLVAGYPPEEFFLSNEAVQELEAKLRQIAPNLQAPLSQIRDWLGTSRKIAITLCESLRERGIMQREDKDWTWVSR